MSVVCLLHLSVTSRRPQLPQLSRLDLGKLDWIVWRRSTRVHSCVHDAWTKCTSFGAAHLRRKWLSWCNSSLFQGGLFIPAFHSPPREVFTVSRSCRNMQINMCDNKSQESLEQLKKTMMHNWMSFPNIYSRWWGEEFQRRCRGSSLHFYSSYSIQVSHPLLLKWTKAFGTQKVQWNKFGSTRFKVERWTTSRSTFQLERGYRFFNAWRYFECPKWFTLAWKGQCRSPPVHPGW